MGSVEELPLSAFRAIMETNYFGAIRCIQAVIRPMRERGSGAIINVTSVAGEISVSPMGPYSASKFALEALSEQLAQELKAFAASGPSGGFLPARLPRKKLPEAFMARLAEREHTECHPCSPGQSQSP